MIYFNVGLPEQAACRHVVVQEQEEGRDKMATGAHPFIAMGWSLRYRGRSQKIDSLWRKWAPVCPLGFLEAQI